MIGGAWHVAIAIFHLLFPRLLRWDEDLAKLTALNRAVTIILNFCLIAAFLTFAYISLVHSAEMVATPLGRSLLACISLFWLFRALLQVVYLNVRRPIMVALFVAFLAAAVVHAIPLVPR